MLPITRKLIKVYFNLPGKPVDKYFNTVNRLVSNNGWVFTIKYMKSVRLHITNYICHTPLLTNESNVSVDKYGWPKQFEFLKEWYKPKDKNRMRALMTLLLLPRGFILNHKELKLKNDYQSIIEPSKCRYTIPTWFIKEWMKTLKFKPFVPNYDLSSHKISMKQGPLGPSSSTSYQSILKLSYTCIQSMINLLGPYQESFLSFYRNAFNKPNILGKTRSGLSGRLSIVEDPELKRRVIAMVDYHSQWALRPIHDKLLEILKGLPCDRTFTQDPKHNWERNQEKFYSLDLSSATDRFPIALQVKVLREIIGHQRAEAWRDLLISRAYETPEGSQVFYKTGQPMGAYSSWAAFTLTHHLVVAWSAHLSKLSAFNQYIILGDDIVIKNKRVSDNYIAVMTKLGVEISKQKTHKSNGTYEFAKRWIHHGSEISGLPLKGIFNNITNIKVVFLNIYNYSLRIPFSPNIKLLELVSSLYDNIKIGKRRYTSSSVFRLLYDFNTSIRVAFNRATYDEVRHYFAYKCRLNDQFVFPTEGEFPSFMKRFLSVGLVGAAFQANSEAINIAKGLKKKLLEPLEDINYLSNHPLFIGVYNAYSNSLKSIKDFNEDRNDLIDTINNLTLIKLDKLVAMSRESVRQVANLDKLWKECIQEVSEPIDEIYYGSSMAANSLDTGSWSKAIIKSYSNTVMELEKIVTGQVVETPKLSEEELMQLWIKKFKDLTP